MDMCSSSTGAGWDADAVATDNLSALNRILLTLLALTTASRVSDIARVSGLPASTTHRILTELADLEWVVRDDSRGYAPGPQLLQLAGAVLERADYSQLARESMEQLRDATGFTVHLGMRAGDEAVYVAKLDGRRAYSMRSHVGMLVPLHCTALGKALLANLGHEEVASIAARRGLTRMTDASITDLPSLLTELDGIGRRGWSVDDGENEEHTRCLGAVIYDGSGRPFGGLSLSGLEFDMSWPDVERFGPMLIATAAAVSARLGFRGVS